MMPERWQQIEQLYNAARSSDADCRAAFLEEACGEDKELRREVEALLAAEDSGSIGDGETSEEAEKGKTPHPADRTIGSYKILSLLGRGGMGEVYLAEDTRLGRKVALKLLPAQFTQDEHRLHRFEREAHAASALSHPNILTIHEIGKVRDDHYIATEFVDGETLRQRMANGPLSIADALNIAVQVASALSAAHEAGIVHRDIKPENIMLRRDGYVKVLDFGLAKLIIPVDVGAAEAATAETAAGMILGTANYMSPEQAEGKDVSARSDVFSLGVVLYEMLCGRRPFQGDTTLSTIAAILRGTPEQPRQLRHEIPPDLERVIVHCLVKKPDARYGSAAVLHRELEAILERLKVKKGKMRRWSVRTAALVVVLAAGGFGTQWYIHTSRVRWAERVALPEVERLAGNHRPLAALRLLRQAEQFSPSLPRFVQMRERLVIASVTVKTTPSAAVYARDYTDTGEDDLSRWEFLGRSPLATNRLPRGLLRIRAVEQGFEPVELVSTLLGGESFDLRLHATGTVPGGMIPVPGVGGGVIGRAAYPSLPPVEFSDFWLDKYEVTNRQFKEFVDAGGYQKRNYWKQPFVKDGRFLSWEQAMAEFRDGTGRPGPSSWELGTYPEGKADFPVGGVSWYEAAAYAEFAGKSLPTVYHWFRAAGVGGFSEILDLSNFSGQGPARVGAFHGIGPFGTYDMAGNVKEWCWNQVGDRRYLLGGGWNEPSYMFSRPEDARRPFDRGATFGFRCAKYTSPLSEALTGAASFINRDRRNDKPASDEVFRIYANLHAYDKTDLKPALESVDESSPYWRRENVTFQAAYGNERVLVHLYLPKDAVPPFQTVVYFPGANALSMRRVDELGLGTFEFIVRSGRALLIPAYKGTLERGPGEYYHLFGQPNRWREMNLQWSKDLGRSIDYLEKRSDIDTGRLAYYGLSLGAAMGPHLTAMEPRFKLALFVMGGSFDRVSPEVDSWNFAPRVKIPVLMLNGRDDFRFPLETSQLPLFHLLGTPEKDKRLMLFDGGHNIIVQLDVIKEVLNWLDLYLGPAQVRP